MSESLGETIVADLVKHFVDKVKTACNSVITLAGHPADDFEIVFNGASFLFGMAIAARRAATGCTFEEAVSDLAEALVRDSMRIKEQDRSGG